MGARPSLRLPMAAVVLCWMAVLPGCGESDESAAPARTAAPSPAGEPPPEAVDVCALMPADEVQAIVGHPLSAEGTSYTHVTTEASCRYRSTEMDLQAVEIRIESLTNPAAQIELVRETLAGGETPVTGIGNHAYYALGQLFVFTDTHQIVVLVGRLPGVDSEEARRRLAESVIARL